MTEGRCPTHGDLCLRPNWTGWCWYADQIKKGAAAGDWIVPEGDRRKVEESGGRLQEMVDQATAYLVRCGSCGFIGGPDAGMCAHCGYDGVDPPSDGREWMPLTEHEQRVGELEEQLDQTRAHAQEQRVGKVQAKARAEEAEARYTALRKGVEEEEKRLECCIKKLSDRAWEVSDQLKKDKASGRDEMASRGVAECAAFCEAVHLLRANLGGILNEGGEERCGGEGTVPTDDPHLLQAGVTQEFCPGCPDCKGGEG